MKELVGELVKRIYKEEKTFMELIDEFSEEGKKEIKFEKWENFLKKHKLEQSKPLIKFVLYNLGIIKDSTLKIFRVKTIAEKLDQFS